MEHIYHYMYAKNHYALWGECEKLLNLQYDGPTTVHRRADVKTKTNIQ